MKFLKGKNLINNYPFLFKAKAKQRKKERKKEDIVSEEQKKRKIIIMKRKKERKKKRKKECRFKKLIPSKKENVKQLNWNN